MKILVALPAYNEAQNVGNIVSSLLSLAKSLESETGAQFRIAVFDDGSTDQTAEVVAEIPNATVIRSISNLGLGMNFAKIVDFALRCNADYLVTCDADGQFSTEDVTNIILKGLQVKAELVLGSRFIIWEYAKAVPYKRRLGNKVVRALVYLITKRSVSDATCGLRMYSREALTKLFPTEKFSYTVESIVQLALTNTSMTEVPVRAKYFPDRISNISGSLLAYGLNTLAICRRLVMSFALRRFLKVFYLVGLVGTILLIMFAYFSFVSGAFSGYLYLAFSGASLAVIGLWGLALDLIILRFDLLTGLANRNHYDNMHRSTQESENFWGNPQKNVGT